MGKCLNGHTTDRRDTLRRPPPVEDKDARITDLERQLAEARTNADLAVALAYQRAADEARKARPTCGLFADGVPWVVAPDVAAAILALAPAVALAEVEALKAERDKWQARCLAVERDSSRIADIAEAAEAEVVRLKEALEDIRAECGCSIARAALATPEKG